MDYIRVLWQWAWVVISIFILAFVGRTAGTYWELAVIGGLLLYRTKKEDEEETGQTASQDRF